MVILPTVFAASAHQCCIDSTGQAPAQISGSVQVYGKQSVMMGMSHSDMIKKGEHGSLEYNGCDISCCGLAVSATLIVYAESMDGTWLMQRSPAPGLVRSFFSVFVNHTTPPPRAI